jgi:Abnormal spindle-like microcephaly-assoc'd, ASPM-SPD-2-Hydin
MHRLRLPSLQRVRVLRHAWLIALVPLFGLLASCGGGGSSHGALHTPAASVDHSSLAFGEQRVGTTAAAQVVTLSNTGNATLTVSGISLVGTDSAMFVQTNTCGSTVAVGQSCTVSVTFTPTSPGAKSSSLNVATNAATSPVIALSGTGTPVTSISMSPSSATVPFAGTQQFTATVSGSPGNGGVTWTVVWAIAGCIEPFPCSPPEYVPCSPDCGTVTPGNSTDGAPVTYTAPARFESPIKDGCLGACTVFQGVFLQATSVSDSTAVNRAAITFQPPSIFLAPTSASVAINATQQITANVVNDLANSGVTWTLSQKGIPCAPDCGTVAPASTASGAATTYTAPANVPALPLVTVTATSIAQPVVSASATITVTTADGVACGTGSGSESLLKGQYAFMLHGYAQGMVGSFTADGTGKVSVGEVDVLTWSTPNAEASVDPAASFYAVGSDHRGCLGLAISGEGIRYLRFALGSPNSSGIATTGRIIAFDDPTRVGSSGTIRLQDATSFSADRFAGRYAMGLMGEHIGAISIAGTFVSDGRSAISSGIFDVNRHVSSLEETINNPVSLASAGTFACCSVNGRGTIYLPFNVGFSYGGTKELSLVFYMINSSDVLLMNLSDPSIAGEALGIPSGEVFAQSSLSGPSVIRKWGPAVDLATASSDGVGSITTHDNINDHGTFTTSSTSFDYEVAANGRVTLTGGSAPPVLYLFGQNLGFLIGAAPEIGALGFIEPQAVGPFSNASLSGGFVLGTEVMESFGGSVESGVVNLDGAGNTTGTTDQSSSNAPGLEQNRPFNSTYSISADGTGTFGTDTTAILISPNKLVYISITSAVPTVTVVEK